MDSENNIYSENEKKNDASAQRSAAEVSSLALIDNGDSSDVRIMIARNLGVMLNSFTVACRFSGLSSSGSVTDSRFFSLIYDREGLNSKEMISMRFKAPDGYNVVGCTAFVSKIEYPDGTVDEFEFGSDEAKAVTCSADGVNLERLKKRGKKLSKGAKAIIISAASVVGAALIAFGGVKIAEYNGVKNVVNGLIGDGRYGEAYKIAEECGSETMRRVACSNIISKSISDRDYKTAYVFATLTGKEKTVFSRVEYEVINSGTDAVDGDAMSVLKKLDNDTEFDNTLRGCIDKACERGDYPAAIAAAESLRAPAERALMRRNLLVDGVCYYSTDIELSGMSRFDKAVDYFTYCASGDRTSDEAVAVEIVNKCLERGDCAGAVVLSNKFKDYFGEFEIDPAAIKITAGNNSIANSLDCAYGFLTNDQKRAFHAQTLDISEEAKLISGGVITGSGINDAVSVATYENRTAVLRKNGSVTHIKNGGHNTTSDVPSSVNGVQIAVGLNHTVVLKTDGTVTAVGDNSLGQCSVTTWTNIAGIAAGRNFTLGLKTDGTVVACGSNKCGQTNVSRYRNVIAIAACDQTAVLLFSDGTVRLCGEMSMGLYNANYFTDVEQIKAGGSAVIAKKTDGTFAMADGCVSGSSGSVEEWRADGITNFAVGSQCIAYTDLSGKLNILGDGAPK